MTVVTTATLAAGGAAATAQSAHAAVTTIAVSPSGIDLAACGPSALPCRTIQYGIDRAADGDTVQVAGGTYNEAVHIVGKQVELAGDPGAVIDGAGRTQSLPGASGVVWVGDNPSPVFVKGFTIKNPVAPSDGGTAAAIAVHNTETTGSLGILDNTIVGDTGPGAAAGQVGIDATGAAIVDADGNDISAVFRGVSLHDSGPATINKNTVHDLVPLGPIGGQGVVSVSDTGTSITEQVVRGNTLRDYAGTGVLLSGGLDDPGCAARAAENPCTGSIDGEITGNKITLDAPAAAAPPGAGIALHGVAGGTVSVALGDNTGVVAAPTRPVSEVTGQGGTVAVTPSGAPNRIVPTPTPTLATVAPKSITTSQPAQALTVTATNPANGDAIPHARYTVALTDTATLTPGQVTLERKVGSAYVAVPLSGSTADGGSLTGSFPLPTTDSDLPADGTARTSDLRIAVTDPKVPAGTLSLATSLVEVSAGTGNPVLNTVVTDRDTVKIIATTTLGTAVYSPARPTSAQVPTMTIPVSAPGAKVDGGYLSVRSGDYLRTTTVAKGKATVTLLKYTGGPHTLVVRYLSTSTAAAATRTYTLVVTKAATTQKIAFSPTRITSATRGAKAIVTVNGGGANVDGGTVRISSAGTKNIGTATVSKGKASIALPRVPKGKHRWTFTYSGNRYAFGTSYTYTFTTT